MPEMKQIVGQLSVALCELAEVLQFHGKSETEDDVEKGNKQSTGVSQALHAIEVIWAE